MRAIRLIFLFALTLAASAGHRAHADADPLLLGEYELERNTGVMDGDTIRCWKLEGGVRMLGVDAEETFKELADRREAGRNWDAYTAKKAAANDLPVKYGSFMGEEAAHFARDFFRGVKTVRLEYDSTSRKKDIYGRHLCYVFATPAGAKAEQNYCVELVRQGYSPYSMKYGHSLRFRKQFEAAEKEARDAKRGIWGDKPMGYGDYEKRLKWWSERASQLERFISKHAKDGSAVELGSDDVSAKLASHDGKAVLLLCNMPEFKDAIHAEEKTPWFDSIAAKDVAVRVCFEATELFAKSAPDALRGYYVLVRGKLEKRDGGWQVTVTRTEDFEKA